MIIAPSGGDDTAAIQAAINSALNPSGDGNLVLSEGRFNVRSLDLSIAQGILKGSGKGITFLSPISGSMNVLDCVGTYNLTISDMSIGDNNAQTVTPQSAIYLSQPLQPAPPSGNIIVIRDVFVSGKWSQAAMLVRGFACGNVENSQFWSYGGYGVILTGRPGTNYPSAFHPVRSADSIVSAFNFFGCEVHSMTSAPAIATNGVNCCNYFGGVVNAPVTKITCVPGDSFPTYGTLLSTDV